VVEGIPVLRQISPVSSTYNQAVEHVHAGDARGALRWLLSAASASGVPSSGKSSTTQAPPLIGALRRLFASKSSELLASSDALTLMGARGEKLWRKHSFLDEAMFRRPDLIALNPLYRVNRCHDGLNASIAWPSKTLESECSGGEPIFNDPICLSAHTLDEIAGAQVGRRLSEEVRRLIRSFVLVRVPDCYRRSDFFVRKRQES
jgi:hypothetical protein